MLYARKSEIRRCLQTLREHSHNVAKMTSDKCATIGLKSFGELLGLIHDQGKSYRKWQDYLIGDKNTPDRVPHSGPGVWFAQRLFGNRKEIGAELTLQMLCLTVRGHHGGIHDALTPEGEPDEPLPLSYSEDENRNAESLFFDEVISRENLEKLFTESCGEVVALFGRIGRLAALSPTAKNEVMLYLGLTEKFIYSSLIDADRADAASWEYRDDETKDEVPSWVAHIEKLKEHLGNLDHSGIGALRAGISDTCSNFVTESSGIYRLYVPTGGGKTLSGLAFALRTAKRCGKDHIFITSPFLTILEQNASAIRSALGETEDSISSAVLEHHSNVVFESSDDSDEAEMLYLRQTERWQSPEIIMTSSVQFLNSLFSGKTAAARRMCALSNSVIIIDEVQAIPSNCTYLFNIAANFLSYICDSVVVLCTATPPALSKLSYPAHMSCPEDIVPNVEELFRAFKRTDLVFSDCNRMMKTDELAEYIIGKFTKSGNCLAVMNTKSVALGLYRYIKEAVGSEVKVFYLSTELCPAHRTVIIKNIRQMLGKNPVICISTQLIEAGVDISFNCVVRSLAGLDSIIQAAGRCNRNGKDSIGNVYVVRCADERLDMLSDISSGVEATSRLLSDFEREPEKLGWDMLSPEAIERYYGYYFTRREKTLGYSIGKDNNAVNLLGFNEKARSAYQHEHRQPYRPSMLAQAFRTVGKCFTPICQNTTGIIVPYGRCGEELQSLLDSKTAKERAHYLRNLQKFTVNVYENKLAELQSNGALQQKEAHSFNELYGIWILSNGFYSEETGINISGAERIDNYIL